MKSNVIRQLVLDTPYMLSSACIPVKGASRSLICDLDYGRYHLIPDALCQILHDHTTETIQETLDKYGQDAESAEAIKGYFEFLVDKNMLFFTNLPTCYPKLSVEWDMPCTISNALIDLGEIHINFEVVFRQLEKLCCQSLQIRSQRLVFITEFEYIMSLLDTSIINSIELIVPYTESISLTEWETFVTKYPRIKYIQQHGAPEYKTIVEGSVGRGYVTLVKDVFSSEKCCGVVSYFYFTPNRMMFTESHHHNTCLNRKVSIDKDGNIKNCPSMSRSFGNISDTKLSDVVSDPEFTKLWNITKDQVNVCRDCEFRHTCTDCRAYLEDPTDLYSKPLKCGYNPYTTEWEDWSTHPLKQLAIDHYDMRELTKPTHATA